MDAECVFFRKGKNLVQRIDGSDGGGSQGNHHRPHIAVAQLGFEGIKADPPTSIRCDALVGEFEHGRNTLVGVVRLLRAQNALPRHRLAGDPESLEVGEGSA